MVDDPRNGIGFVHLPNRSGCLVAFGLFHSDVLDDKVIHRCEGASTYAAWFCSSALFFRTERIVALLTGKVLLHWLWLHSLWFHPWGKAITGVDQDRTYHHTFVRLFNADWSATDPSPPLPPPLGGGRSSWDIHLSSHLLPCRKGSLTCRQHRLHHTRGIPRPPGT